jgi:hypothetical protein
MKRQTQQLRESLPGKSSIIRCAIYTRKSTENGLDMDFNSLDAQRESAEAYIESQKTKGGFAFLSIMTMVDSPGEIWSDLRCSALWQTLKQIRLTALLFTKLTG